MPAAASPPHRPARDSAGGGSSSGGAPAGSGRSSSCGAASCGSQGLGRTLEASGPAALGAPTSSLTPALLQWLGTPAAPPLKMQLPQCFAELAQPRAHPAAAVAPDPLLQPAVQLLLSLLAAPPGALAQLLAPPAQPAQPQPATQQLPLHVLGTSGPRTAEPAAGCVEALPPAKRRRTHGAS